ncbi:MAG: hypothetical protein ACRD0O_18315 [Acidimicrobiia bacterium]
MAGTPWRRPDAVAVVLADALAAVLLLIAWWGASRQVTVDGQAGWTNLGVAGLIVAGIGNGTWILFGRAALRRRTRGIVPGDLAERTVQLAEWRAGNLLVGSPTLAHFHRSDCPLVSGRAVATSDEAGHRRLGRQPCGMCRP